MRAAVRYLTHLIGVHHFVVVMDDGDTVVARCTRCDATTYAASPSWGQPQHFDDEPEAPPVATNSSSFGITSGSGRKTSA